MQAGLFVMVMLAAQVGGADVEPQDPTVEQAETGANASFNKDVSSAVADERQRAAEENRTTVESSKPRGNPVVRGITNALGLVGAGVSLLFLGSAALLGVTGLSASTVSWGVLAAMGGNLTRFDVNTRTALVITAFAAPALMVLCVGLAIVGLGGLVTAGAFFSAAQMGAIE